jgi:hypothetical protein
MEISSLKQAHQVFHHTFPAEHEKKPTFFRRCGGNNPKLWTAEKIQLFSHTV